MFFTGEPNAEMISAAYDQMVDSANVNEKLMESSQYRSSIVYNKDFSESSATPSKSAIVLDWFNRSCLMIGSLPIYSISTDRYYPELDTTEPFSAQRELHRNYERYYEFNADEAMIKTGVHRLGAITPVYRVDQRNDNLANHFYKQMLAGRIKNGVATTFSTTSAPSRDVDVLCIASTVSGGLNSRQKIKCPMDVELNGAAFPYIQFKEYGYEAIDIGNLEYTLYETDSGDRYLWCDPVVDCKAIRTYTSKQLMDLEVVANAAVRLLPLSNVDFPRTFKKCRNRETAKIYFDNVSDVQNLKSYGSGYYFTRQENIYEDLNFSPTFSPTSINVTTEVGTVSIAEPNPRLLEWADIALAKSPSLRLIFDKIIRKKSRIVDFSSISSVPVVFFPETVDTEVRNTEYYRASKMGADDIVSEGNIEYIKTKGGEVRFLSTDDIDLFKVYYRSGLGGVYTTTKTQFLRFITLCLNYDLVPNFSLVTLTSHLTRNMVIPIGLKKQMEFDFRFLGSSRRDKDYFRRRIYFKNLLEISENIEPTGCFNQDIHNFATAAFLAVGDYHLQQLFNVIEAMDWFAKKKVIPFTKQNPLLAGDCMAFTKLYLQICSFSFPMITDELWRKYFGEGILLTKIEDYLKFEVLPNNEVKV